MNETLERLFGFRDFKAGQQDVISRLLEGRSVLAIFPTGGGKSLCYQLPAMMLEGTALVVSPLLALMKDQVDGLIRKGIPVARLDSSLSKAEYQSTLERLLRGELKLLYVSPEKLGNAEFFKLLKGVKLSLMAIDEAHCLSEWGHNFRPDYLKLGVLRKKLRIKRILALTATATPHVAKDICRYFHITKSDVIKLSFHRPNLDLRIYPCEASERKSLLLSRLQEHGFPAVVYCTRQETAEEVATFLAKNGQKARAYHAGLRAELRQEVQDAFMKNEIEIVVATIAFGMGVDKANIRQVLHYNMPKSLEGYTQEIGRAGRDGFPAICEWFACGDDRVILENFIYADTPSPNGIRNVLERILNVGRDFDLSVYDLSASSDIRQTVISTVLAYLEMEGTLEAGSSYFNEYKVKLLRPLREVYAGRKLSEIQLLRKIFSKLEAEWKIFSVEIKSCAETLGVSEEKVRKILDELETSGEVSLKKSNWRKAYHLKTASIHIPSLAEKLSQRFQQKETAELARLEKVIALALSEECFTKSLLSHFGEKRIEPCGHCDRCRSVRALPLPITGNPPISDHVRLILSKLYHEQIPALGTPRQFARFLCGMSSPATFRARLYRHDAYGLLSEIPFKEVEMIAASFFSKA